MTPNESFTIRPRFNITVVGDVEDVIKKLKHNLQNAPVHIQGSITKEHITVDIIGSEQHFWSPHIDCRIESGEIAHTSTISGLVGPKPEVWTLFIFLYFSIIMIGFIMSSYGISKWMMNEHSSFIWGFPVALLLSVSIFAFSKLGEKLGADQTEELKGILRQSLQPVRDEIE